MGRCNNPLGARASADARGFAAARAICRRHARSFYFSSFLLPGHKRDAAYAVYAFCRIMDDTIDRPIEGSAATADVLERRLANLRGQLDGIYAGRPNLPPVDQRSEEQHALHAFAVTVHRYRIEKNLFLDLVEGCRMDLIVGRYESWGELERYCYHVAGVVGLIMCRVFGLSDPSAEANAVQMGNAMQLTNILRDVKEDLDRGRIYLPREDLRRFGVTEADLSAGTVDGRFRDLMRFEIARARELYRRGAAGLWAITGRSSRLTAAAMGVIYGGILDAIERQDYDVFTARAHLTTLRKLARLPAAWRLSHRRRGKGVPHMPRAGTGGLALAQIDKTTRSSEVS